MTVVNVLNTSGEKVSEVDLKDEIFQVRVEPAVLHEVVKMQLANRRKGTACSRGVTIQVIISAAVNK